MAVYVISITHSVMSLGGATDHRFVEMGAIALYLAWNYFVIHLMRYAFIALQIRQKASIQMNFRIQSGTERVYIDSH